MASVLNGPLETGIRVLMLLTESEPDGADLNRLVFLDHCMLHSGDVGGPPSLHPPLPIRSGELGAKRDRLHKGLQALTQAGMVTVSPTDGIRFIATDIAAGFVAALESPYATTLHERAQWVVETFRPDSDDQLRERMRNLVADRWEEFEAVDPTSGPGADR